MRTLLILLAILGAYAPCPAQSTDSLLALLPKLPEKDKVAVLLELGKSYFIQGQDSLSKLYATRSYQLAHSLKNPRLEGEARLTWVRTEMNYSTSLEEAYAQLDTVDRLAAQSRDQDLQGWAYFRRAQIYSGSLKYAAEVEPLFMKALAVFEESNNVEGMGSVYVDLGARAAGSGNLVEAVNYFLKGKKLLETLNRPVLMRASTANLAGVYHSLGKDDLSIRYSNETIRLARQLNDPRLMAYALGNLGDIYLEREQFPRALVAYTRQEKVLSPFEDQSVARAIAKKGMVLFKLKKYGEALANCRLADSLYAARSGYEEAIDYFIEGLYAEIFLATKQYQEAIAHAQRGIDNLTAYGDEGIFHLELSSFHSYLATAYEELGQPAKALFHYKKFKTHSDSLINNDALEKIANATMTYEFEKKEEASKLRITTLENEKLRQSRTSLLLLLMGGVGIIGLIGWSNRQLKTKNGLLLRKNKEIEEALYRGQSIERKRVASELHDNLSTKVTALRWNMEAIDTSTMAPHNVKIYDRIMDLSGDIYTDIRLISHSLLPAELEKNGLEAALLRLMKMLENNRSTQTYFHLLSDLKGTRFAESLEYQVYVITLELINNIIRHAQASEAWITVSLQEGKLWLTVNDNGVGLSSDASSDGMGSDNLRARIAELNGEVAVESEQGQGTRIKISVPVESEA
jgi:signal transduction histidine kinase